MKESFKIVVCSSGGGGNFESLISNQEKYAYKIEKLITDRLCGAIDVAKKHSIPYLFLEKNVLKDKFWNLFDKEIRKVDLIVLAGFMPIIPEYICKKYEYRIINTHPSLLPKYGGKGMYGVKVQEAVMANNEKFAGCTVHYVNSGIDTGDIILQKKIKVDYTETPWELGGRIYNEEIKLLPIVIGEIVKEFNNK